MLYEELDVMEYAITMETLALECDEPVEDDFDDEPYFSECGYNPYMGCYDFDCQSKFFIARIQIEHMFVWSGPWSGRACEKFNAIVSI